MVFWVPIAEIALIFSVGLHHRLGISDFGRGLCGEDEAELVAPQLMDFLGLGIAFHPQFAAVGGEDGAAGTDHGTDHRHPQARPEAGSCDKVRDAQAAVFLLGFLGAPDSLESLWEYAERVGFEPTVSITPRPISNRVP